MKHGNQKTDTSIYYSITYYLRVVSEEMLRKYIKNQG